MAEFVVKTDLAPVTSLVIEANFDEIKNELAAKVAAYVRSKDGLKSSVQVWFIPTY